MLQDHLQDTVKKTETEIAQLKQDLDKVYADSQAGKDVGLELTDIQRAIDSLRDADQKIFDIVQESFKVTGGSLNDIMLLILSLADSDVRLADMDKDLVIQNFFAKLQIISVLLIMALYWFFFKSIDMSFRIGIVTLAILGAIELTLTVINYYLRRRQQKESIKSKR